MQALARLASVWWLPAVRIRGTLEQRADTPGTACRRDPTGTTGDESLTMEMPTAPREELGVPMLLESRNESRNESRKRPQPDRQKQGRDDQHDVPRALELRMASETWPWAWAVKGSVHGRDDRLCASACRQDSREEVSRGVWM
ncbi:hypothetical protein Q7P37_000872 [Cladosporium fusiforme]